MKRLLIVDDETPVLHALQRLQQARFDVLISD